MKCILALLTVAVTFIPCVAQQSKPTYPCTDVCKDSHVFDNASIVRCLDCQRSWEEREAAEDKLLDAKRKADELKRAADDVAKVRSGRPDQQIDGMTDAAKDANSHVNNNAASKAVTEKSLSVIDRWAQMENQVNNDTGNAVQSISETPTGSTTPYSAGGHELHESIKTNVESQPLTIEQRYRQQDQTLLSAPSVRSAVGEAEPTKRIVGPQTSIKERYNNQENEILLSPRNVKAVADADRAIKAAEQVRRDREAKEEAARQVEVARQAKEQAEQQRLAKIENDRQLADKYAKIDREYAEMVREDKREAARAARAQQAAWNAMFGLPAYVPDVPAFDTSNLPAFDTSNLPASYIPNALPYASSGGSGVCGNGGQCFCDKNPTNLFCGNSSAKPQNGDAPAATAPTQAPPATPSQTAK